MFNKRTLEVKVVKDKRKNQAEVLEEEDFADKFIIVNAAANNFVNECAKLVASYMVLDTIRKVAIALASK
jgi:hypothetical protein